MKKLVILTIVAALFIGIPFSALAERKESRSEAMCKGLEAAFSALFESIYGNLGQCVAMPNLVRTQGLRWSCAYAGIC